jgi:hypothetical protein
MRAGSGSSDGEAGTPSLANHIKSATHHRIMLIGEVMITAMFVILFSRHLNLGVFNGWTIFYGVSMVSGIPFIVYRWRMLSRHANSMHRRPDPGRADELLKPLSRPDASSKSP